MSYKLQNTNTKTLAMINQSLSHHNKISFLTTIANNGISNIHDCFPLQLNIF